MEISQDQEARTARTRWAFSNNSVAHSDAIQALLTRAQPSEPDPRNHFHACGHRPLRHGEPGFDALYAQGTAGQFHRLATRSGPIGGDPGSATCSVVAVYPEPTWPYNITPYLFLVSLIFGFAYMQWREWRNPAALRRSATMLIRSGSAGEAEAGGPTRRRDLALG